MTGMRVTVVAATILPGPDGGRLQHNAASQNAGTSGGTNKRSTLQRRGSVDGQTLPTLIRPSLAAERIESRQGLLDAARDMLKETVAPAEIRRAVFDMLMSMPAIKHQDAKDRLGRPSVSFWLDSSGEVAMRLTLFLDREQGLLGEEQTLLSALDDIDAAPPVVIGYVTYVDARLVDTTAEVTK